jgi:uncharacterized protein YdeI (YjbR/CyaY-like superfamily)
MRRKSFATVTMNDRESWRAWLAANHASAGRTWLVHFKNGAKPGVGREEAVEEALCFGWILLARRADTRARRIAEAVRLLDEHRELGLK